MEQLDIQREREEWREKVQEGESVGDSTRRGEGGRAYRMYMHDYMPCVRWCLKRSEKRTLNPLELEVQAVVSHLSSPELVQN